MAVRVIVTRPAREAARWVEALAGAGIDAVALPLIDIAPVEDSAALRAARAGLADHDALMFVSAAAVEGFLEGVGAVDRWPRCWATGPGTVRALRAAGVPQAAIDAPPADAAQFDSEALWQCVRTQVRAGTRVLIVRGGDAAGRANGRDWLAREIEAAGGACEVVVAYRRLVPALAVDELHLAAQGASGEAIWLFSSSEAIGNLRQAMPATDWHDARVIATHARIAQAAREAGFGTVRIALPSVSALVASIESFA